MEDVYEKARRSLEAQGEAFAADVNAGYACNRTFDAPPPPQPRTPPQILAQHAEEHRLMGLQLRAEGLSLIERSLKHLAVAGEFEHARSRIID